MGLFILDLDFPWPPGEWSKYPGADGKKLWVLPPDFNGREWITGLERKYRDKMNEPFKANLNAFLDTDIARYAFGFGRRLEDPFVGMSIMLYRSRPPGEGLLIVAYVWNKDNWLIKAGVMEYVQVIARVQSETKEAYDTALAQAAYWVFDAWCKKEHLQGNKDYDTELSQRVFLPSWVKSRI